MGPSLENTPPPFWSMDFHLRYFPMVLVKQIKDHPDSRKGHVLIEVPIMVVACGVMMALGLPSAIDRHSIVGWVLVVLGGGGLAALVIWILKATAGSPLSYSEFEPWVFLFLTLSGTVGGLLGGDIFGDLWLGFGGALVGLILGYFLGIGVGLGAQRLGPLRAFVALAAAVGLFIGIGTLLVYLFYIRK